MLTHTKLSATKLPLKPDSNWPHRVHLFGVDIDVVNLVESVALVHHWISEPQTGSCRYIVTPNIDHVVMLRERADLRAAYADASLVIADGWPVVAAARWLGKRLPERVAGSDLVPAIFAAANESARLRVYLLGAAPGVGARAAEKIHSRWQYVDVVGCDSPPLGFEHDDDENRAIISRINQASPDLLVVGLGAPKQELWIHKHRARIRATVAICAGATIDFLAGEKNRAPQWMQRFGLEWFHRLAQEPRRLVRRYARDAVIFPQLVWQERARG